VFVAEAIARCSRLPCFIVIAPLAYKQVPRTLCRLRGMSPRYCKPPLIRWRPCIFVAVC